MIIPKQFQLLGQTIVVEWDDSLAHTMDALGTTHPRENKIKLQKPNKGWGVPAEKLEHTYYHELVHWILLSMSQTELFQDEVFVDTFAGLLHQAIKSAKGEMKF